MIHLEKYQLNYFKTSSSEIVPEAHFLVNCLINCAVFLMNAITTQDKCFQLQLFSIQTSLSFIIVTIHHLNINPGLTCASYAISSSNINSC